MLRSEKLFRNRRRIRQLLQLLYGITNPGSYEEVHELQKTSGKKKRTHNLIQTSEGRKKAWRTENVWKWLTLKKTKNQKGRRKEKSRRRTKTHERESRRMEKTKGTEKSHRKTKNNWNRAQ